ncbi:hypothetical protein EVAR_68130_1 [Eumeta japonica]|uniref:Uncharacterized protein n=1 Tax=Eumeta variegata TaxID=151549 RepID=A0A4C1ZGW7_EUMVA|nr:hypothetical protein EVAR_68130_1 [Eumeta japonica]
MQSNLTCAVGRRRPGRPPGALCAPSPLNSSYARSRCTSFSNICGSTCTRRPGRGGAAVARRLSPATSEMFGRVPVRFAASTALGPASGVDAL